MLGASVAVVCISSIASAANQPTKVAPVYVPPSYSWTGCYIGANAGGAWERVRTVFDRYQWSATLLRCGRPS